MHHVLCCLARDAHANYSKHCVTAASAYNRWHVNASAGNRCNADPCVCLQLYWPDDKKWYLIEVHSVNPKARTAK